MLGLLMQHFNEFETI